ncbi:3-oxoacyl-[acyl-carrier protein] reductase [Natronospira proteinivora]|uniref:3-oxoacyl-[acyl-carrier-protein] reductase n=1 Tax=Natronospira proteinivora TaxID=1807133 RepID=A0ABT1G6E0_9GAMM|nr:3-oxoacyl-ACP reductase FabG [Natronospira proteinivora]MCP1726869.1 3-oxoacyl-[acyl-carrier protein] reductase [Natronospira proteinivora]
MLDGKLAVVTGASRGIGSAIARSLAEAGAQVVGTATSDKGAAGITEALKAHGGQGLALDVSSAESIEAFLAELKQIGAPVILVNNAAVTRDNLMMRMKDDEWNQVIDTNLTGVFRLSKALLRGMMKAKEGRIVNIGSVVGFTGNPGQVNYCAAKAAVVGFSKAMAREVGSRNITVNTVAPGFIETDMTRELPEAQREAMLNDVALGRLGQPEDIAGAVRFLVSPEGAYITGETIHVNGGLHMD